MDPISFKIPTTDPTAEAKGGGVDGRRDGKLRKACADFEAMLVFQMLKTMRQTIPRNGLIAPSQGRATYEMMLDQKIAEDLSRRGEGLGIQRMLYEQLARPGQKKD